MSIQVEDITKMYGSQKALDKVSFSIGTGEVVGFLGPNGAGKSTMMKILTCFIPPTSGSAKVCGMDVMQSSMQVRKKVGYLPEHNPLYLDMFVREYLLFIAGLHKLKGKKEKVDAMIEKVGLIPERKKRIGALSKGYRQRVGLAQAMIHDPDVLILDEPTSGLDPNQLDDIRSLISDIGKKKTVMLSTHIMQEVEAICDRVIIVNEGQIVTDKSADQIKDFDQSKQVVSVEFDQPVTKNQLRKIKGVSNVRQVSDQLWVVEGKGKDDIRPAISQFAQDNKLFILTISKESQKLEEVFKGLTKK